MSKQERVISREVLGKTTELGRPAEEVLEIAVTYQLGGSNWFTGGTEPRGYYLRAIPQTESSSAGGFKTVGFMLGSGGKVLLLEAKRFSAKTLAELQVPEEKLAKLRERVLADHAASKARRGVA